MASAQHVQSLLSRSGRQVFMGDLERRRPTKRMTTVRSFAVVKNWVNQNKEQQSSEIGSSNVQSDKISSRTDATYSKSPKLSHEPLGVEDVFPMSDNNDDGDGDIRSTPDKDMDVAPLASTSYKNTLAGELVSDMPQDVLPDFNDIRPMIVDESPMKDEVPQHTSGEGSLPGGETSVADVLHKGILQNSPKKDMNPAITDSSDDDSDSSNDNGNLFREKSALRKKSRPETLVVNSGEFISQPRPAARKRVACDKTTKEKQQPRFDEEEYEAQNFVRLFNADRGRKGNATDITDLDVVLTNIEEVALEIKGKTSSALEKKMVKEAFIQIRQIFSDTIDIYKEKKYLQSATAKGNRKIKKMKQELLRIQAERKSTEAKLDSLKSKCSIIEKRIKGRQEAYEFLSEFESFQNRLRESDTSTDHLGKKMKGCPNTESLPSLLCEASGYLSSQRQIRNINDKLQLWLDKNET